jgi:hypothetical protein
VDRLYHAILLLRYRSETIFLVQGEKNALPYNLSVKRKFVCVKEKPTNEKRTSYIAPVKRKIDMIGVKPTIDSC